MPSWRRHTLRARIGVSGNRNSWAEARKTGLVACDERAFDEDCQTPGVLRDANASMSACMRALYSSDQ